MTTKILTVRIQQPLYKALCSRAAELGVPVAVHVRHLVEDEHQANQIENLRSELLAKLDVMASHNPGNPNGHDELLLLARGIAAHLNPQMVAQIRARLVQTNQARPN